jgi:acyl carrier protein
MAAGLDSIGATELSTRMSSRLETELPQTLLFDHPSLRSIAASLRLDDDDASPSAAPDLETDEAPARSAEAKRPREIAQGASGIIEMVSAVVLETAGTSLAADTPLMSAGLDSIATTALATTLAQRVDAELPQTLLFDHPTTGAVASFVAAIAPAVEQFEARGGSEP